MSNHNQYNFYREAHGLPTLDEKLTVTPARSLAELDRIVRENMTRPEYNDFRLTVKWENPQAVYDAFEQMVREIEDPFSDAALLNFGPDDEIESVDPRDRYAVLEA